MVLDAQIIFLADNLVIPPLTDVKNVIVTVLHVSVPQTPNVEVVTYGNISTEILVEPHVLLVLILHGYIEDVIHVTVPVLHVQAPEMPDVLLAQLEDINMAPDVIPHAHLDTGMMLEAVLVKDVTQPVPYAMALTPTNANLVKKVNS